MHRRLLLLAGAASPLLPPLRAFAASPPPAEGTPFTSSMVREAARDLASKPYAAPNTGLPDQIAHLGYDQYRMIRFDPAQAIWRNEKLPFQLEFFHRGFLYANRVDVFEVADGRATPIRYTPAMFSFGAVPRPTTEDLGFAGFRIHARLNRQDYFDEVCAFVGASYFRAVARGQGYGLSARGLAIKTADQGGEEFPAFKTFWIERPKPGATSITVHALLDSPSAAASFSFVITPGSDTVFDTHMSLFPRVDIEQAGIAPLTSMFFFGPNDRARVTDWRPAVHDSDGLSMWTGHDETLWRQLANPSRLQVSAFVDHDPKGFGLLQTPRSFDAFQDLEAHYEKRPSLWVEPQGRWGDGAVMLVEIPTDEEIHDNIVSFWRPKDKLQQKIAYDFAYRLHWCDTTPRKDAPLRFGATRIGNGDNGIRDIVLDTFPEPKSRKPPAAPTLDLTLDHGQVRNQVLQPNPETGGWRVSFELVPGREQVIELHARLLRDGKPLTETWLYRWTP